MSQTDLVYCLLNGRIHKLSSAEKLLVEIILFTRIYHEMYEVFKSRYKVYQQLITFEPNREENMFGVKFMQELIRDIISTNEYSLTGISTHTRIPEEVLLDMAAGISTNPTFELCRKIFELHIGVRRDLYDALMQKIASEYLTSAA